MRGAAIQIAAAEMTQNAMANVLSELGKPQEALPLYRWIMPLLHLDARPDLVQCIKLCEALAGRGTALTRPPRLPLDAAAHAEVSGLMRRALDTRPTIEV